MIVSNQKHRLKIKNVNIGKSEYLQTVTVYETPLVQWIEKS